MPYEVLAQRWRLLHRIRNGSGHARGSALRRPLPAPPRGAVQVRGPRARTRDPRELRAHALPVAVHADPAERDGDEPLPDRRRHLQHRRDPSEPRATIRSRTRTLGRWESYVRFGSSALAYATVILAGWLLGRGSLDAAFRALLVVVLVLAVVSLRNSWELLVSVGAATLRVEHDW